MFVINDYKHFNLLNNDITVFLLNVRRNRKYFNELVVVLNSPYIKFYIICDLKYR
jgi:hypothetical protein